MTSAPRPDSIEGLFARFGPSYRWLVTATVMMGTIATILTATIVNVALPDIMGAFGMGQDKAQLLSTGFLAAMTGTMLLNAWMVDTLGQRATFMLAITIFIAASIMGGLAPAEGVLILARVLQGGAAGILQPLAMQTIFQVFPPEKRGSAMGIYGIGVVLAPALGPTLGGIMVDSFSWRYVFFMAVPFCFIGLFMAAILMPGRATSGPPRKFDWIGFGLMTVFLVTLLNGLSNGQRDGWISDPILRDFAIALVAGIGFIVWELRTSAPMLNLKLFTNRVYAGASVVAFIFGAGIFGSTFLIPLFVQTIQGYTPTRSAWASTVNRQCIGGLTPLCHHSPKCQINPRRLHRLRRREAVLPEGLGSATHYQQATVFQHKLYLILALLVPEDKPPRRPEAHRSDCAVLFQLGLVITVPTHCLLTAMIKIEQAGVIGLATALLDQRFQLRQHRNPGQRLLGGP